MLYLIGMIATEAYLVEKDVEKAHIPNTNAG